MDDCWKRASFTKEFTRKISRAKAAVPDGAALGEPARERQERKGGLSNLAQGADSNVTTARCRNCARHRWRIRRAERPRETFTPINLWDVNLRAGKSAELPLPDGHTTRFSY